MGWVVVVVVLVVVVLVFKTYLNISKWSRQRRQGLGKGKGSNPEESFTREVRSYVWQVLARCQDFLRGWIPKNSKIDSRRSMSIICSCSLYSLHHIQTVSSNDNRYLLSEVRVIRMVLLQLRVNLRVCQDVPAGYWVLEIAAPVGIAVLVGVSEKRIYVIKDCKIYKLHI